MVRTFSDSTTRATRSDVHWKYWVGVIQLVCARKLAESRNDPAYDFKKYSEMWQAMLAVAAFRMVLQRCNEFTVANDDTLLAVQQDVENYCDAMGISVNPDGSRRFPEYAKIKLPEQMGWNERWNCLQEFSVLADHAILDGDQNRVTLSWRRNELDGVLLWSVFVQVCRSSVPAGIQARADSTYAERDQARFCVHQSGRSSRA